MAISRIFDVFVNIVANDEKKLREIAGKFNPRYVSQLGAEHFQVCFFSAEDLTRFTKYFE